MTNMYKATLVRGQTYYLGTKLRFERGKPVLVDEEQKVKLEASAIDRLTVDDAEGTGYQVVPKFKFEPVSGTFKAKADKAEELRQMQGNGDVDFDDDEEGDETGGTGGAEGGKPAPAAKPATSRSRTR